MLGNGDELKRDAIPVAAPSKPPRTASFKRPNAVNQEEGGNHENPPNDQQPSEKSESRSTTTDISVAAEIGKESIHPGGANEGDIPVIKLSDSLGSRSLPTGSIEASNKSGGVENSLPVVRESEAAAAVGSANTKVQNHTEAQLQVHSDQEGTHTQDAYVAPNQSEMKSVEEESESTKPITATATTTTSIATTTVMMENSTEKTATNQINESHSNSTTPKESESKPNGSVVEDQQPTRKSSFGTSKIFRAEDSLFETALLLGKLPGCHYLCQAPSIPLCFN